MRDEPYLTLHQMRVLWAIGQAGSFTRASKLLDVSQPSMSQLVAKVEEQAGVRLFERGKAGITLTDAGRFLVARAEEMLRAAEEAEAGLRNFARGRRDVVRIGTLASLARLLLPAAWNEVRDRVGPVEFDVIEGAPSETIELLHARRLDIAILATDSLAPNSLTLPKRAILSDPYVLATPGELELAGVDDPEAGLGDAARQILGRAVRFRFGSGHDRAIEAWYRRYLPATRTVGQTRQYETLLAMVDAGVGVGLVPAFTSSLGRAGSYSVNRYATRLPDRQIVAMAHPDEEAGEPVATILACLQEIGAAARIPETRIAPFLQVPDTREGERMSRGPAGMRGG
jgi:DNA-binding transcriptional LysR family regulator